VFVFCGGGGRSFCEIFLRLSRPVIKKETTIHDFSYFVLLILVMQSEIPVVLKGYSNMSAQQVCFFALYYVLQVIF